MTFLCHCCEVFVPFVSDCEIRFRERRLHSSHFSESDLTPREAEEDGVGSRRKRKVEEEGEEEEEEN